MDNKDRDKKRELEREQNRIRMNHVASVFVKNVAKVIKYHRDEKGYSQEDLALGIGQHKSVIGKYERGEGEISASAMAKISVFLKFPLKEYTQDIITKKFGDAPKDIDELLIRINEAKRIDEIEKELRKPLTAPSSSMHFQDVITKEPRQMSIEDYMDSEGIVHVTPVGGLSGEKQRKPPKYKGYGYVKASEDELAEAEYYLMEVSEMMPLYKKTSIANIYQAIAAQILEAQGNDVRELAQIAKATIKYAINETTAKKRKKIETYLDFMADNNLAYKYREYPWQISEE